MANAVTSMPENNSLGYEIFYTRLVENPPVQGLGFNFIEGQAKKDLYFNETFGLLASAKTACGWTKKEGGGFIKKSIDPQEFDFTVAQCYTPILKSIFGDKLPNGHKRGELYPEIINYITEGQLDATNRDLLYILFLSDKQSTEPFLSKIDGVYKKLLEGVADNDGTVDAGAVTDTDLLPDNMMATMKRVWDAQPRKLRRKTAAEKKFYVTGTVYYAYENFLQTKTGNTSILQTNFVTDGVAKIAYNGVELINLDFVDEGLALYGQSGSPASTINPNRIILTVPSNHTLQMDGSGYTMIDPQYILADDEVLSPLTAMLDYQYGFGDLNVFAGF